MSLIVREDDVSEHRNVEKGPAFPVSYPKGLTPASRFPNKSISNREVSELVVSFKETLLVINESPISTRFTRGLKHVCSIRDL